MAGTAGSRYDIGFLVALKAELFTARHTAAPWVLLALPVIAVMLRFALVRFRESRELVREALSGSSSDVNPALGYGQFVDGASTGLTVLYLILVAAAAYSFAAERDNGVIRHLVIRRVSRSALVLAKFTALNLFAMLAVAVLLLVTGLGAYAFWEFGPVIEDGYELIGADDIQQEIRLGLMLAVMPLPAALAMGLFVATCVRTATQAVAAAIGVTLALDVFKGVLGDAAHYLFSAFQPSLIDRSYLLEVSRIVRGYSDVLVDERVQQLNLLVPAPEALLLLVLALGTAARKRL
jgi:hypothetical protein